LRLKVKKQIILFNRLLVAYVNIFNSSSNVNFLQILTTVLTVIVYPYSIYILKIERHKLLPSVPPHGHGLVLLGFWTLVFVAENLVLINIGKLEWWFHLNS